MSLEKLIAKHENVLKGLNPDGTVYKPKFWYIVPTAPTTIAAEDGTSFEILERVTKPISEKQEVALYSLHMAGAAQILTPESEQATSALTLPTGQKEIDKSTGTIKDPLLTPKV